MMLFAAIILISALLLAELYYFVLTPGDPNSATIQRPQERTSGPQSR
jgi:hypothetical protein